MTVLGTYLDPLADKIFINSIAVSLWYAPMPLIPGPVVALWLMKDVVLMGATYQYVAARTEPGRPVMDPVSTPLQVSPTTTSKVNTVLQFSVLMLALMVGGESASSGAVDLINMTTAMVPNSSNSSLLSVAEGQLYDLFSGELHRMLPPLCTFSAITTIASMTSYLGFSAFSRNKQQKL
jgi:phosphatidylglycerophosphate synthase